MDAGLIAANPDDLSSIRPFLRVDPSQNFVVSALTRQREARHPHQP